MSGTAAPSEGASTNIYQCLSNKGDTRALGKSDLLGGPIIDALLDMPEGTDKILRQVELEERARDLGIKAAFDRLLNSRRKEWQAAMRVRRRELKALQQPVKGVGLRILLKYPVSASAHQPSHSENLSVQSGFYFLPNLLLR